MSGMDEVGWSALAVSSIGAAFIALRTFLAVRPRRRSQHDRRLDDRGAR